MWLRREWSNTGDRRETALAGRVGHCSDLLGVLSLFRFTCIIFFPPDFEAFPPFRRTEGRTFGHSARSLPLKVCRNTLP